MTILFVWSKRGSQLHNKENTVGTETPPVNSHCSKSPGIKGKASFWNLFWNQRYQNMHRIKKNENLPGQCPTWHSRHAEWKGGMKLYVDVPEITTVAPASMTPLFGRTQYLRGAVVFTLKHTLLSEGFFSLRFVVTTSVKGPGGHTRDNQLQLYTHFSLNVSIKANC